MVVRVPQTVAFRMRMRFDHIERAEDKPREIEVEIPEFEGLYERYGVEKRRRARGDRATSAMYRMVLTDYGKEMIASDDDHYSEERYADAINGRWYDMPVRFHRFR